MNRRPAVGNEEQIRRQVKEALRKQMRAVRSALPMSACKARSQQITDRVIALSDFESAQTILAFSSIHREVRTHAMMRAAWTAGKRVALPRVTEGELLLHLVDADSELTEGPFGVPEPPETATQIPSETVDFALVPALAVDPRGHRIGYGGGYYDRLLPRLDKARSCAVVFDFQLVAEVPEVPVDVPVDIVVTDHRVIQPR